MKHQWLISKAICFFICAFLISSTTLAQTSGIGLWTGVNLEKKVNKHISIHGNIQARFSENVSVTESYLGELGGTYKLNKHFEFSGYYRFSKKRKWNDDDYNYYYRAYHRFYADASYDTKIAMLKFDYRLRYQNQFKDAAEGLESTKSYLRNKFELSYPNKTRFLPYISTDVFYQIGENFNQLRNKAGVEIILNRYQKLNVYGFTDYQLDGSQKSQLILGLSYKIKF